MSLVYRYDVEQDYDEGEAEVVATGKGEYLGHYGHRIKAFVCVELPFD